MEGEVIQADYREITSPGCDGLRLRDVGVKLRFGGFRKCMNTDQYLCENNTWPVRNQSTVEFRMRFSLCLVIFRARAVRDRFPW
jgi:hypothetical protein